MAFPSVNPATGMAVRTFDAHTAEQVEQIVARASEANPELASAGFEQRAAWMNRAADLLESEADEVAAMITTEMGKPLAGARAEALKCVTAMRYFAAHAQEFLADEHPVDPAEVGARRARVVYQPVGTVLAIMPWNFPFWQVIRFAAPALMAGNTGLLKHAPSVPQCALYLGELFARAGFPAGAFQSLLVEPEVVSALIEDRRIAAVTLTGSVRAGADVGARAAAKIKKSVLELGGSDPFVVLDSADLDRAVDVAVTARTQNSGQSCIAAKRFLVQAGVYENFLARFTDAMAALVVGDPTDDATDLGPLISEQARTDVHAFVEDAVQHGATVHTGGKISSGPGYYYPPTVITGITPAMRLYHEECFGPVAGVYEVADVAEAVALANATDFGLSSAAFTSDDAEIEQFVSGLQAGAVFINGMSVSYPQLPFGGTKTSGYGRELSAHGIREFCTVKTVWVA